MSTGPTGVVGAPATGVAFFTRHARQRCQQMQVPRARVEAILADPTMTYAGGGRGMVAWSSADPGIAVIYVHEIGQDVVLTVVPRTYDRYERETA